LLRSLLRDRGNRAVPRLRPRLRPGLRSLRHLSAPEGRAQRVLLAGAPRRPAARRYLCRADRHHVADAELRRVPWPGPLPHRGGVDGPRLRESDTLEAATTPGRAGRGAGAPHAAVGSGARTARRSPAVPLNTRGLGLLALGAAAACGSRGPPAAQLRARITRPPRDTLRFVTPAIAERCGRTGRRGLLLQGTERGNGVPIHLRSNDSVASGELPLLARGDSTTERGAVVAGAVVTAVASRGRTRAAAVAREFDIAHAFGSGEELARCRDVDLVFVSSTPDAHARHAIAALEAGKHVLCEKPMALTAREAE